MKRKPRIPAPRERWVVEVIDHFTGKPRHQWVTGFYVSNVEVGDVECIFMRTSIDVAFPFNREEAEIVADQMRVQLPKALTITAHPSRQYATANPAAVWQGLSLDDLYSLENYSEMLH